MKISIYVLLALTYFLTIQASCNDEEPRKLIPNDSTFLSYWYFPKDSYWIYKDSASNQRDTFLIVDNFIIESSENHSSIDFQQHWIQVKNRNRLGAQVGRPRRVEDKTYYYELDQRWGTISYAIRFFYDPDNKVKNLGGVLLQLNQYDSLKINNTTYNDVIYMYNYGQGLSDNIRHEYYAKNIGVVKRIDKNGVVWILENYNISN
jgi:hypothetical protein